MRRDVHLVYLAGIVYNRTYITIVQYDADKC